MQISLYDTIQSHIKDFENQLYTCIPAIVHSYNPSQCSVDVYPSIYRAERDGKIIKEEILSDVPLHFQATAELGITFPIRQGDTVLLIFGYCDTENWLTSSDDFVKPKTYRKHNINDAFAIAGVFKQANSPVQPGTENDLNIRYNGNYIRMKQGGNIEINTSANLIVNADNATVNVTNDASITATSVTINSDDINLGGAGGAQVARIGDVVTVSSGSSAGTWPITSGSSKVKST